MNRITHFEIYTEDPEAVRPFYQDVFSWKFQKFEGGPIEYWLITTGDDKDPGINGGMTRPRQGQSAGTLNTIAVSSLDQTIKKVEQRGGKICVPKMAIPKVGWLAYTEDTAGNVFGLIEPDAGAKSYNPFPVTFENVQSSTLPVVCSGAIDCPQCNGRHAVRSNGTHNGDRGTNQRLG